jgi:hypothetical protein
MVPETKTVMVPAANECSTCGNGYLTSGCGDCGSSYGHGHRGLVRHGHGSHGSSSSGCGCY